MSELRANQRNKLNDNIFGIPSLRKYPLNDAEHVRKAIQMFHHCPYEYKKELANNINKYAKYYGITITKDSAIYEYLNESAQLDIDFYEDIYLLEQSYYFVEDIGMNESEAKGSVDVAIDLWKKRKKFLRNDTDKSRLVRDLKAEKAAISSMQDRGDFRGIILRAKASGQNMNRKLAADNYALSKFIKGKSEFSGNNRLDRNLNNTFKTIGRTAGFAGAAIAGGAALGGLIANKKANYNGDSNIRTGLKTAGGAAAGLAAGTVVGAVGAYANEYAARKRNMNAADPEKSLRQHAERYVNFINNYQSEILDFYPQKNNENQQNEEGED